MIGSRSDTNLSRREPRSGATSPPRSGNSSPCKQRDNDTKNNQELPSYYSKKQQKGKLSPLYKRRNLILGGVGFITLVLYLKWFLHPDYWKNPCDVAAETLLKVRLMKDDVKRPVSIEGWKPQVPKVIHHQWKDENIPPMYQEWHKAWFDLYPEPEYTHMHWSDEAGRKLIAEDYAFFLKTYDEYDYTIKRVDATRYFALHKYGGIHADLDYEPMINFYDHLPQDRVSVVESPYQYYEETQNSLMASPKNDPFWLEVFKQLEINKMMGVMEATGPKLIDTVRSYSKEPVHVLPCQNFQRINLGSKVSPALAQFHKELLGRVFPMKQCGNFADTSENSCQFARHHCSASYLSETGLWDLLWKK